jgi:hypothetical protein
LNGESTVSDRTASRATARESNAQQAALHAPFRANAALVQILPNLRSFKFSEKTALIRIEYGQKPSDRANPAFKAPC